MDGESLATTLKTGQAEFSMKSESPGQCLTRHRLLDLRVNGDGDSLTVLIERETGETSGNASMSLLAAIDEGIKRKANEVSLFDVGAMELGLGLNKLYGLIAQRKEERPEGSYTSYLFNSGLDKILKKIAEESGEVIVAAKNATPHEIVAELADLFYHLLVLMVQCEVKLAEVNNELSSRALKPPKKAGKTDVA
jgi:phosphoribosyl-ATP pyrophosphohydrolase/phosphoribosyl-AMP cyclohydrolase